MNLDAQVAHARALLGNGKRITELMTERDKLSAALEVVDEELGGLLASGQLDLPLDNKRTTQKCSRCGAEGHTKRTCTQPAQGE